MTGNQNVGVAIIGTGIGRIHASAIASMHESATLSWVCSQTFESASQVVKDMGAGEATDSYQEVLDDPSVQAIILCTPPNSHLKLATQAFEAGKHVLIEKPLSMTVTQGQQILQSAQSNGRILMVGHNQRYFDHYVKMKEALDSGAIGNPVLLDSKVHVYGRIGGFRTSHEIAGGGTLIDSGIHKFDLFRWLLGDIESVYATGGNFIQSQMDDEDMALVQFRFCSGAIGSLVCSWSSMTERSEEAVSVFGSAGSIHAEDHSLTFRQFEGRPGDAGARLCVHSDMTDSQARSMQRMDQGFISAVLHNTPPPITGTDGLMALAVVEAAYRSIRDEVPVRIDAVLS